MQLRITAQSCSDRQFRAMPTRRSGLPMSFPNPARSVLDNRISNVRGPFRFTALVKDAPQRLPPFQRSRRMGGPSTGSLLPQHPRLLQYDRSSFNLVLYRPGIHQHVPPEIAPEIAKSIRRLSSYPKAALPLASPIIRRDFLKVYAMPRITRCSRSSQISSYSSVGNTSTIPIPLTSYDVVTDLVVHVPIETSHLVDPRFPGAIRNPYTVLHPRARKPAYSLKSPPGNIPIPKSNLTVPPNILKPALEQPLPEPRLHKDDPVQRILEPPLRDGDSDVAAGTCEE
jgi:hypothetical protein